MATVVADMEATAPPQMVDCGFLCRFLSPLLPMFARSIITCYAATAVADAVATLL